MIDAICMFGCAGCLCGGMMKVVYFIQQLRSEKVPVKEVLFSIFLIIILLGLGTYLAIDINNAIF